MMKISLHALIKILLENGETFALAKCCHGAFDENTIKFCVNATSVPRVPYFYKGEVSSDVSIDRFMYNAGSIALHYDMAQQNIVSICDKWRKILEKYQSGKKE